MASLPPGTVCPKKEKKMMRWWILHQGRDVGFAPASVEPSRGGGDVFVQPCWCWEAQEWGQICGKVRLKSRNVFLKNYKSISLHVANLFITDPFQVLDARVRPARLPTGRGGHRCREGFQVEEELWSRKPHWLRVEQVAERIYTTAKVQSFEKILLKVKKGYLSTSLLKYKSVLLILSLAQTA